MESRPPLAPRTPPCEQRSFKESQSHLMPSGVNKIKPKIFDSCSIMQDICNSRKQLTDNEAAGVMALACMKTATPSTKGRRNGLKRKHGNDEPTYWNKPSNTLRDAKLIFQKHHSNTIGVYKNGDTYVTRFVSDLSNIPIDAVDGVQWLYIRCLYKKSDEIYVNVTAKVVDIEPTIRMRGPVRLVYELPSDMVIKLHHYTCCSLGMDHFCRSCQHPSWNSRCCVGRVTFFLTHKH